MPIEGFGLLVGHLVGDYVLQNDWQAKWKTGPSLPDKDVEDIRETHGDARGQWLVRLENGWRTKTAFFACTIHCFLYTLTVWACAWWWMPWWGLLVCFAAHWPIDRFRLARRWMVHVAGQKDFATGPLSPWSIIVVDNTFHLLTLFVIALLTFRS